MVVVGLDLEGAPRLRDLLYKKVAIMKLVLLLKRINKACRGEGVRKQKGGVPLAISRRCPTL